MTKESASKIYKALGEPNRLKIIKLLINNGEICACKLLEIVNCRQSTLSHHLSKLEECGLLRSRREKKNIFYSCDKVVLNEAVSFLTDVCDECAKIKDDVSEKE